MSARMSFRISYTDDCDYELVEKDYCNTEDRENDNPARNQVDDSDEDTDEASENDMERPVEMDIKEQMYQVKLAGLKKQLYQLKNGTHPDLMKRFRRLERQYKERVRLNKIHRDYMIECVERDYVLEKEAANREYREKKEDLKDNLITDLEDKKKQIESERYTLELMVDSADVKPMTRQLRRRPNDPLPVLEKPLEPPTVQLVLLLDDKEIESDLRAIARGKPLQMSNDNASNATPPSRKSTVCRTSHGPRLRQRLTKYMSRRRSSRRFV